MSLPQFLHLLYLFFAHLEPPEVVLYEKRGVELADSDLVTAWWRYDLIKQFLTSSFPQSFDNYS